MVRLKNLAESADALSGETSERGDFAFGGLEPGEYLLSATKPGHLEGRFGASVPERDATPIAVTAGQQVTGLVVTLVPAGGIAGVVRGAGGDPAAAVTVLVIRQRFVEGRNTWVADHGRIVDTDDDGRYRIVGLAPDRYLVAAVPMHGLASEAFGVGSDARPRLAYVPSYYPGTQERELAATVQVGFGDVQNGTDVQLVAVPTGSLRGTITAASGMLPPGMRLIMSGTERDGGAVLFERELPVSEAGAFESVNVPQGRYDLSASGTNRWADDVVTVTAGATAEIALFAGEGSSVSGSVVSEAGNGMPAQDVRLTLTSTSLGVHRGTSFSSVPRADGGFLFRGVRPDQYRLDAHMGGPWILGVVTAQGTDVTDRPFDVAAAGVDLRVIISGAPAELSGRLTDAGGAGASAYFLVLYPADERDWQPSGRRIRTTRPDTRGNFEFAGLPPGVYFLTAATDLEPGQQLDRTFLRQLTTASPPVQVSLHPGERAVENIRLAAGSTSTLSAIKAVPHGYHPY